MDSASPDETLWEPDMDEPGVDSASPDEILRTATNPDAMIRTSTNYDERQQSTASQKDDVSDYNLELKDGDNYKLPWVTKVTNLFEDLAGAGKDNRDAAGYDLGVLAKEAGLEDVTTYVPRRSSRLKELRQVQRRAEAEGDTARRQADLHDHYH